MRLFGGASRLLAVHLFAAHLIAVSLGAAVLLGSAPAEAQLRGGTAGVLTPGVSLTAPDDALAVDVNPAALAFLDAFSLLYTHADPPTDAEFSRGGDALYVASPLFFGISAGLSIQHVRPGDGLMGSQDRGMATLALAWGSRRFGLGTSVRWFGTTDPALNDVTTFDLALSWRPAPSLAVSLLGRDLNGPLEFAGAELPASFVLGISLRPAGTRAVSIDLAGSVDTDGEVGLRGAVSSEIPYFGRVFAAAELSRIEQDDPNVLLTGGAELVWGGAGIGGGAFGGDGFGDPGWFVTARLDAARRTGLPTPRYVYDLEVGGTGARGILALIERLDRARSDERVYGVLLRFRDSGIGMAYAQELRQMIEQLTSRGKPVVCHLDAASGSELYACSSASRTLIDPAGGIRLSGPSVSILMLGDVLRELGIRADFVRIGRYKSAPEQLTNRRSSEPAREQRDALYDDVYHRLVADLARDRDVGRPEIRQLIDDGPYAAPEAVENQLVNGYADGSAMREALQEAFGGSFRRLEEPPRRAAPRWGVPGRVGVLVVDGDIVDGENVDVPFVGIHMTGAETVIAALDQLVADSSVDAIVLRIDSPGGSALASDQIWRAVMRARRRKPVIASMGSVAASGGYYVAAAADEIWADPATITGSIGIFFGKVDVAPLAERLGVGIEQFSRGRHAGLESLFRPFTAEERALVADKIRIWYRLFLQRIEEGRGMSPEATHALAQGRVWSGDAALRRGLVDRLGGFGSALARARELAELPPESEVVYLPRRPSSLLDYVLTGSSSTRADEDLPQLVTVPPVLRDAVQLTVALGHIRDGVSLARMPQVVALP